MLNIKMSDVHFFLENKTQFRRNLTYFTKLYNLVKLILMRIILEVIIQQTSKIFIQLLHTFDIHFKLVIILKC